MTKKIELRVKWIGLKMTSRDFKNVFLKLLLMGVIKWSVIINIIKSKKNLR